MKVIILHHYLLHILLRLNNILLIENLLLWRRVIKDKSEIRKVQPSDPTIFFIRICKPKLFVKKLEIFLVKFFEIIKEHCNHLDINTDKNTIDSKILANSKYKNGACNNRFISIIRLC